MSLQGELDRFEASLRAQFPHLLEKLEPGLNDEGVSLLRDSLAPMLLTEEVETLYRWRNGGLAWVFGGWMLYPLERLLQRRPFFLNDLGEPPAWLRLFDDQCMGCVSLDVPGESFVRGVWYAHTEDGHVSRLFESLESLVCICADALEAGELHEYNNGLRYAIDSSLMGHEFDPRRVAHEAVTFVYPNPPEGTQLSRFPDPKWPRAWLASLGADPDVAVLRGATHTIAELVDAARAGSPEGTVRGTVVKAMTIGDTWSISLDDGTGQLAVHGSLKTLFAPGIRRIFEVDVIIDVDRLDNEPEAATSGDKFIDEFVGRRVPSGVVALGLALRPVES